MPSWTICPMIILMKWLQNVGVLCWSLHDKHLARFFVLHCSLWCSWICLLGVIGFHCGCIGRKVDLLAGNWSYCYFVYLSALDMWKILNWQVLRLWLLTQNLSFMVAGFSVTVLLIYSGLMSTAFVKFTLLVALINISGAVGTLSTLAGTILIEREWYWSKVTLYLHVLCFWYTFISFWVAGNN